MCISEVYKTRPFFVLFTRKEPIDSITLGEIIKFLISSRLYADLVQSNLIPWIRKK